MRRFLFVFLVLVCMILSSGLVSAVVSTTNVSYHKFNNNLEDEFFNIGALTPFGGAAIFNTTSQSVLTPTLVIANKSHYYQISNVTAGKISQIRTVEFWLRRTTPVSGTYFFGFGKDPTDQNMFRVLDSANNHQVLMVKGNSVIWSLTTSGVACNIDNNLRKQVIVLFESNTTASIYVNTNFCGRTTVGGNAFPDGDWNKIRLNGRFDSAPGTMGRFELDNLILSETLYTGDDINDSYNAGQGRELVAPLDNFSIVYNSPLNNSNLSVELVSFNFSVSGLVSSGNDTCFIRLNGSQVGDNISVVGGVVSDYVVSRSVLNGSYVWGVGCFDGFGVPVFGDFNLLVHVVPEVPFNGSLLNESVLLSVEECSLDSVVNVLLFFGLLLFGLCVVLLGELLGLGFVSVVVLFGLCVFVLFVVPCVGVFGVVLSVCLGLAGFLRLLFLEL